LARKGMRNMLCFMAIEQGKNQTRTLNSLLLFFLQL
jgi:hypothetical protein